jgi:hypothetical protein
MDPELFLQLMQDALTRHKSGGADPSNTTPMGWGHEVTWTEYIEMLSNGKLKNVRVKETSLTLPSDTLYGCMGLFGLCGPDEIIGMTMQDDPFIQWLGMFPDTVCEKSVKGWIYTDIQGTAAGSPVGEVAGPPCDDPPTSEKSVCEFYIGDFGTYRGCGEAVDVTRIGERKCDKQPTYTIPVEGVGPVRIDNDLDLETINAGMLVRHEVSRDVIIGDNDSNQYEMAGLENLVKTGYVSIKGNRCTSMDSRIMDWQNDNLQGTVNGYGSIIGAIRDMWRAIRWRIYQTKLGMPREGDVALLMPSWLSWRLLDEWAWWALNAGRQYEEVFRDNLATRQFRDEYSRGLYNGGYIKVDNFNLHIIEHDWMPINQDAPEFCGDIYMLVRSIGGRRVFQGQYMPADLGVDAVRAQAGYQYFNMESIQGGRGLKWLKFDNACVKPCVLFRPRLYLETPWAQGKIENVCVSAGPFMPLSVDPRSNYFLESNKVAAERVTQYWYDDNGWFH